jgi:hypothetical protein
MARAAGDKVNQVKRAIKLLCIAVAVSLLFLFGCVALDQIPHSRATPPKTVTDVASCLVWLKNQMGAYRVTVGKSSFYQITGPAGRYIASGPAAYSFDAQGQFIGWTQDMGDFYEPREVFSPNAKREKISTDELKHIFKY